MNKVFFFVPGEPQGKGRPRFSKVGNFVKARTPDNTVLYENLIKTEYKRQYGSFMFDKGEPLTLEIKAYYSIPQSKSKKQQELMRAEKLLPTKKPDWDNIGKVVADSLNKIAYYDDSQIVAAYVSKFYSDKPRVEITIKRLGGKQ